MDTGKKRKVAIYARVSTEHEAQISALENQIQYYDNILEQHPNWELYDRYIDEGITGTSVKKRKNFMRMMEDASKQKFDLILTREVSRFARNTVDTLQQTRILKSQGVEVYFTEDNIWTMNDEDGELRLTIMATLAQNESKKTSIRVKAGQMISFQNAIPYGNGNILGYERVGKEYIINENQAATVRRIFDLYEEGKGVRAIKFQIEKEGRRTSTGLTNWSPGTVSRVLRNPFYCGTIVYRKEFVPDFLEQKKMRNFDDVEQIVVEGNHTPIISKEQFARVQATLDSKSASISNKGRRGVKVSDDVWMRKCVCECGHKFNRVSWHTTSDGIKHYAYQCQGQVATGSATTRANKGLSIEGICTVKAFPRWKLEVMADMIFQRFWNDKEGVLKIANEMLDKCYVEETDETQEKIAELNRKLEAWEQRYDNLVNMRIAGEIDKSRYDKKRDEMEQEREALASKLDELQSEEDLTVGDCEDKLEILKYGLDQNFDFSSKKIPDEIIDLFVDQIVVHPDSFDWKLSLPFSDDYNIKVDGKKNNYNVISQTVPSVSSSQHRQLLPISKN